MSHVEASRHFSASRRGIENESVALLEKNLNNLKRQFGDLEHKLTAESRAASLKNLRSMMDNRSALAELNTKLFIEKENLEKKALSTLAEKSRLEETVSGCQIQNSYLGQELHKEQSLNKKIIKDNIEVKKELEVVEHQKCSLGQKLEDSKTEVRLLEIDNARNHRKMEELKKEHKWTVERNTKLNEKVVDRKTTILDFIESVHKKTEFI